MSEALNEFPSRRRFLVGASTALLCAPAIVRPKSLMQLRGVKFSTELAHYNFVTRLWVSGKLPAIRKYQNMGLSAHGVAAEMNKRGIGFANCEPWDADGVLSVIWLDENIRQQDAIIRAERLLGLR